MRSSGATSRTTSFATAPRVWRCARSSSTSRTRTAGSPGWATRCRERTKQRTDFRVGGKLGSEPEIFVQGRLRKNWFINERNLFHFRETLFWTNRDGFGATTSFDFDHVVKRTMLLRWGNIGTVSEATDGLEWRSALLLYQSLNRAGRALAYEVFIRGESAWEVPLKEWGVRGVYRQPLMRRDWLAGEFVLGYSWPRFELEDEREGSLTVGLGLEILVGGWI